MNQIELIVLNEHSGERIDKFLSAQISEITRSSIQKLIIDGGVDVNDQNVTKNYKVKTDDQVVLKIPDPVELEIKPQDIPIEIVYQDDDLLIVNKPKGMVVHPAPGNYEGTLVNALMYKCRDNLSSINGVIRPGIVHRIDKNTSGLLIIAKNDMAHSVLSEQIKQHSFTRQYEAVVCGRFKATEGTVDAPIGRHYTDRKKMCVTDKNSKNAITHYTVIRQYERYSHIKLRLETGRTHQIRVHMAYIGHPVLGDDVYGKPFKSIDGQCLHAKKIGFIHPRTKEYLEFDSDLPDYFIDILNKIKQ